MKEIKFTPLAVSGKPAEGNPEEKDYKPAIEPTFTGHITLKMPTYEERLSFIEDTESGFDDQEGLMKEVKNFKFIKKLIQKSKPFYIEIALKRIEDGFEFKSFEDLDLDADCGSILQEVGFKLMHGFKVSKN